VPSLAYHREKVREDVGVEVSPHADVDARDVSDLVRVGQDLLGFRVPEQHLRGAVGGSFFLLFLHGGACFSFNGVTAETANSGALESAALISAAAAGPTGNGGYPSAPEWQHRQ